MEDYTGFPEMLDGRVKTLNPRIYAGLLAVRSEPRPRRHAQRPRDRADRPGLREPVPVRARWRQRRGVEDARRDREHRHRRPDADPRRRQEPSRSPRWWSRRRATTPCSRSCARTMAGCRAARARASRSRRSRSPPATTRRSRAGSPSARRTSPAQYTRSFEKVLDLPYGENPHQRAAFYSEIGARTHLMSMVSKLHGRELTFNNLLDLDAGRRLVDDFELPVAAIDQAQQPVRCGDRGGDVGEAFDKALATDPQSAYGGDLLLQPPGRPGAGREAARAVRGGDLRARLRRGRARGARAEAERAAAREPGAPPHPGDRARRQARARRDARAGPRHRARGARGDGRGDASASRPRRSGASCCSRCGSASTCARTRSCWRRAWARRGSGPAR